MRTSLPIHGQHGTSLIEVLVTVVILTFGLLGLVGLQSRLQMSEMESYQRAQAMILLDDMAHRITANRSYAPSYVTVAGTALGTGANCPVAAGARSQIDASEWCRALLGAAERYGASDVGTLLGGRGCVERLGATSTDYMVTVAWQGMGPISAPPTQVTCGKDAYDGGTGSSCTNDLCRRVVTTIVSVATLN